MEKVNMEQQLADINQKLDFITATMAEYQRKQREMDELKNDLTLIARDVFDSAVTELNEVAPYFDTGDLVHLLKKLLRNTRNINRLLTQMESVEGLFQDLKPLGKQMFDQMLETLDEMDRKGYFEFMKEATKIVDTIVTSFSVEDVRLLRENITSILLTIKGITQPDMLQTVNSALQFFKKMDITIDRDISWGMLLKEIRDPEVKKGLLFMLEFVKSMAKPNNGKTEQTT